MRLTLICFMLAALPARAATDTYTMADFDKVPKIDAHLHLHGDSQEAYLAQATSPGWARASLLATTR